MIAQKLEARAEIRRTMPNQTRISASAMSEVQAALKTYCEAVMHSDLSFHSQATYVDMVNQFVRWLKFEFEPGSRMVPYPARSARRTR